MSNIANLPTNKKGMQHIQFAFEVKQIDDADDGFFRFEGLASTFGNIDLVDDIVERGAFTESLTQKLPIILWQHFSSEPIGMPEEIRETQEGLFIRVRLPKEDTLVSGRVMPQIKVGSVRTMSIGFRIKDSEITSAGIRRLLKIDLMEVSLVTFPANPLATVSGFKSLGDDFFKDLKLAPECEQIIKQRFEENRVTVDDLKFLEGETIQNRREFEKSLRESGLFSKNAATKLAAYFNLSESSDEDADDHSAVLDELSAISTNLKQHQLQSQLKSISNNFGD